VGGVLPGPGLAWRGEARAGCGSGGRSADGQRASTHGQTANHPEPPPPCRGNTFPEVWVSGIAVVTSVHACAVLLRPGIVTAHRPRARYLTWLGYSAFLLACAVVAVVGFAIALPSVAPWVVLWFLPPCAMIWAAVRHHNASAAGQLPTRVQPLTSDGLGRAAGKAEETAPPAVSATRVHAEAVTGTGIAPAAGQAGRVSGHCCAVGCCRNGGCCGGRCCRTGCCQGGCKGCCARFGK